MAIRFCRGLVAAATSIGKSLRILCMTIFITFLLLIRAMLILLFLGLVTKIMIMTAISFLHVLIKILLTLTVRVRMVKAALTVSLMMKTTLMDVIFHGDAIEGHLRVA